MLLSQELFAPVSTKKNVFLLPFVSQRTWNERALKKVQFKCIHGLAINIFRKHYDHLCSLLYFFSKKIMAEMDQRIHADIARNGVVKGRGKGVSKKKRVGVRVICFASLRISRVCLVFY